MSMLQVFRRHPASWHKANRVGKLGKKSQVWADEDYEYICKKKPGSAEETLNSERHVQLQVAVAVKLLDSAG